MDSSRDQVALTLTRAVWWQYLAGMPVMVRDTGLGTLLGVSRQGGRWRVSWQDGSGAGFANTSDLIPDIRSHAMTGFLISFLDVRVHSAWALACVDNLYLVRTGGESFENAPSVNSALIAALLFAGDCGAKA